VPAAAVRHITPAAVCVLGHCVGEMVPVLRQLALLVCRLSVSATQ
jgi:hypothetical protein